MKTVKHVTCSCDKPIFIRLTGSYRRRYRSIAEAIVAPQLKKQEDSREPWYLDWLYKSEGTTVESDPQVRIIMFLANDFRVQKWIETRILLILLQSYVSCIVVYDIHPIFIIE